MFLSRYKYFEWDKKPILSKKHQTSNSVLFSEYLSRSVRHHIESTVFKVSVLTVDILQTEIYSCKHYVQILFDHLYIIIEIIKFKKRILVAPPPLKVHIL